VNIAPQWAFNAQAIHDPADPHLATGIHLRVLPSQMLGLPAMPYVIYRVNLGNGGKAAHLREDIIWTDEQGRILITPFTLQPGSTVTGWLPSDGTCCWIEVLAQAAVVPFPVTPLPTRPD
jgi:hypothetical protein